MRDFMPLLPCCFLASFSQLRALSNHKPVKGCETAHLKSDNLCRWNNLHIEFGSFFILSFQLRLRSLRCFRLLIKIGNVSKFEYDKSSILMHLNFDMQALRNGSPRDVSHTKQYSSTALSFRFMFISWRKDDKLWLCHLIHKFNMHLN